MHSNHTTENGRKPQETTQVNAKCCCVKVREYQVTVHLFPGLSRMGCKPVHRLEMVVTSIQAQIGAT